MLEQGETRRAVGPNRLPKWKHDFYKQLGFHVDISFMKGFCLSKFFLNTYSFIDSHFKLGQSYRAALPTCSLIFFVKITVIIDKEKQVSLRIAKITMQILLDEHLNKFIKHYIIASCHLPPFKCPPTHRKHPSFCTEY